MLKRSMIKIALPVAASALVLSACGSDDDSGDGGKTYTIGFQAGLSGENAQLGINEANGAELAVVQWNNQPNVPFKIKLTKSDDEASETKAASAAQKLIDDSKVIAVIGPAFSGPTKASGALYAQAKLATVSPSATNPTLTDPSNGFTSLLRGVPNDFAQGSGMATYYAQKLKLKKVLIVDDKSEYGVGLSDVAKAELTKAGVQVVSESVPKGTPDYTSAATTVKNSGADGMIYAGYYQDAAPFAKKLKEQGVKIPMISGDGTNDPKFIELAGDAADNWYLTCPCTDAKVEPATKDFTTAYTAQFKEAPSTYSAESFDLTNMVIQEIKKLDEAGTKITRELMLTNLKKASYKGLTKTFSFDEKGEFAGKGIYLYEVKAGKIGYLGNIEELAKS
ncbi:branched-chain amino acid ABC transporter substrate-binding protein [Streptodolium elevatio]|uniref:Branched-chain amino acid ABC transporter substrate-binding protein n=1 Tax=Streptodolium elevatio TaxID=3157996 RepID=A0ABV3DFI3_9ACTN